MALPVSICLSPCKPFHSTLPAQQALNASASDNVGVSYVIYYDGTTFIGSSSGAPYAVNWNTTSAANGTHNLTAQAHDAAGNVGTSTAVTVTLSNDKTPPITSITSPSAGATLTGTVTLTASASDNVGVTRVEFYDGSTLIGSATAGPSYSVSWNTIAVGNGNHSLTSKAYDAANNNASSAAVSVSVGNGGSSKTNTAVYDSTRRAPTCAAQGASCTSGTLLNGRASLGPESNAPNTIGGTCADGTYGTYHSDESLDKLTVATTDGTILAAGKPVQVTAVVWAYSGYSSDHLDLYYTANASSPSWTLITTLAPTAAGQNTLSATYTLPTGSVQAVRGVFRYSGSAAPCTTGGYDDHDDLVFTVQ
jgi:hypothetical protein